jgi:hypothetical protein
MSAGDSVRVDVELAVASVPIAGTLRDGRGAAIEFSGWLELMSGFETICERAAPVSSPRPPAAPARGTGGS